MSQILQGHQRRRLLFRLRKTKSLITLGPRPLLPTLKLNQRHEWRQMGESWWRGYDRLVPPEKASCSAEVIRAAKHERYKKKENDKDTKRTPQVDAGADILLDVVEETEMRKNEMVKPEQYQLWCD